MKKKSYAFFTKYLLGKFEGHLSSIHFRMINKLWFGTCSDMQVSFQTGMFHVKQQGSE